MQNFLSPILWMAVASFAGAEVQAKEITTSSSKSSGTTHKTSAAAGSKVATRALDRSSLLPIKPNEHLQATGVTTGLTVNGPLTIQSELVKVNSNALEVTPLTIDYLGFAASPTFYELGRNEGSHYFNHRFLVGSNLKNVSVFGLSTKLSYRVIGNIRNFYAAGKGETSNQLFSPWVHIDWSNFTFGPGAFNFRLVEFTQFWGAARDQGKRGQTQLRTSYSFNKMGPLSLAFFVWLTHDWNSSDTYVENNEVKANPLRELAVGPDIVLNITDKITADAWVAYHATQMAFGETPSDVWTWAGLTYNSDNYGSFSTYLNGDSFPGDPFSKQFGWLLLWSKTLY